MSLRIKFRQQPITPHLRAAFLLVLLFVAIPLTARAQDHGDGGGPESGGGGGIVRFKGEPVLSDFFLIPGLVERALSAISPVSRPATPSSNSMTMQSDAQIPDPAFALASELLNRWSQVPLDWIGADIRTAMDHPLEWIFVDSALPNFQFFRAPEIPKDSEIQAAAYYTLSRAAAKARFTVEIERPIWRRMRALSQAGLIIHEALREVQIARDGNFNDEILQRATAILVGCAPSVKFDQFLQLMLENRADLAESRFAQFDEMTHDCVVTP